jgi:Domain of unknown function (DU1801)
MISNLSFNRTTGDVRAACTKDLKPVFDFLYALVREHSGECLEIAWPRQRIVSFGVGPKKMSEHHCYIAVYAAHINLGFYHGATLSDPSGILEGTGKGLRHVKVSSLEAVKNPLIVDLIRKAFVDRVSFKSEAK